MEAPQVFWLQSGDSRFAVARPGKNDIVPLMVISVQPTVKKSVHSELNSWRTPPKLKKRTHLDDFNCTAIVQKDCIPLRPSSRLCFHLCPKSGLFASIGADRFCQGLCRCCEMQIRARSAVSGRFLAGKRYPKRTWSDKSNWRLVSAKHAKPFFTKIDWSFDTGFGFTGFLVTLFCIIIQMCLKPNSKSRQYWILIEMASISIPNLSTAKQHPYAPENQICSWASAEVSPAPMHTCINPT